MGHDKRILNKRRIISVMLVNIDNYREEGFYLFKSVDGETFQVPIGGLHCNAGEYYIGGYYASRRNLVRSDLTRRSNENRHYPRDNVTVMNGFHIVNASINKFGNVSKRRESKAYSDELAKWNKVFLYNSKAKLLKQGVLNFVNGKVQYKETPGCVNAVIPSIVESLPSYMGYCAFPRSTNTLNSITFRAVISHIPANFAFGTSVKSVTFCDGLKEIGHAAFESTQLEEVDIPKSVNSIASGAFARCDNLKSVKFNGPVFHIGKAAFAGCQSLKSIKLPNGIPEISSHLFYRCSNLEYVFIPKSVKKISSDAFDLCPRGVQIMVPKHLENNLPDNMCSRFKVVFY